MVYDTNNLLESTCVVSCPWAKLMSILIKVLSALFALLHKGEPIERTISGNVKKEVFEVNSNIYHVESLTVSYTLKTRFPWVPKTKAYGIIVRGRLIKDNMSIELGSREYPLLVPRLFKGSVLAHIAARKRYLADISDTFNNNEQ